MPAKKIAAGNWKMHGTQAALEEAQKIAAAAATAQATVLICPPATLLAPMAARVGDTALTFGGQDCHSAVTGAHTGDVSAAMLLDAGAAYVIVGHSERRSDHGETDAAVKAKAEAALAAGLTPIICIGETLEDRDAGRTLDVVLRQLAGSMPGNAGGADVVVAYEPVWAIGTGKVATPVEIAEVHMAMRSEGIKILGERGAATPLLYGGSVKPSNAAEIFAVNHVDGALVGGASLKAAEFNAIIAALDAA